MTQKFILLDLDGVLITAHGWRPVEIESDGFFKFNEKATKNFRFLLQHSQANIVLTTSHRATLKKAEWKKLFERRFTYFSDIFIVDENEYTFKPGNLPPSIFWNMKQSFSHPSHGNRLGEIIKWVDRFGHLGRYVIIDDDVRLNNLPWHIKEHWVKTLPLIGLDHELTLKALSILDNKFH